MSARVTITPSPKPDANHPTLLNRGNPWAPKRLDPKLQDMYVCMYVYIYIGFSIYCTYICICSIGPVSYSIILRYKECVWRDGGTSGLLTVQRHLPLRCQDHSVLVVPRKPLLGFLSGDLLCSVTLGDHGVVWEERCCECYDFRVLHCSSRSSAYGMWEKWA